MIKWQEELKERYAKIEAENKIEMEKWWNKVLPRKGSLLRQLIVKEINKNK